VIWSSRLLNTVLLLAAISLVEIVCSGLANTGHTSEVAATTTPGPYFSLDFSGYTGGSVEKWLETHNFKFEKDAKNRRLLGLSITGQGLELTANGRLTGFILNDSVNLNHVTRLRIKWGIRQYPHETSYEKQLNNEALMVYFFFGKEKVSSGHILIPDSPYFIGLFLCQEEQINFPYKGRYFHTGGRFVCLGKPPAGEMVVSEFDLDRGFKNYFGKEQTPGITGIALGVDTSKAGDSGKAAAFLKSIEFF
jgi:hypothetical protein